MPNSHGWTWNLCCSFLQWWRLLWWIQDWFSISIRGQYAWVFNDQNQRLFDRVFTLFLQVFSRVQPRKCNGHPPRSQTPTQKLKIWFIDYQFLRNWFEWDIMIKDFWSSIFWTILSECFKSKFNSLGSKILKILEPNLCIMYLIMAHYYFFYKIS